MSDPNTYTVYFGGELFSAKHLFGNAALAEAIFEQSHGRFTSVLPQNLEQREVSARAIRDQDLRTLLDCDLGLFHYDGPELDSGTVVEYLFAKFADIPSVLLRTDFRHGGDQLERASDAWNLMSSFYPRTKVVQLDSMALYKQGLVQATGALGAGPAQLEDGRSLRAGQWMTSQVAAMVIEAFESLLPSSPVLPQPLAESVYEWLALMPGLGGDAAANIRASLDLCARKKKKGLL